MYYVAESFAEVREQLRSYVAANPPRRFEVLYEPHSQSIQVLDTLNALEKAATGLQSGVSRLANAIKLLNMTKT